MMLPPAVRLFQIFLFATYWFGVGLEKIGLTALIERANRWLETKIK